jgi:hypothetical protein
MRFLAKILLAVFVIIQVSGCGLMDEVREDKRVYNVNHSYAKNIATLMWLEPRDFTLPPGVTAFDVTNDENKAQIDLSPFFRNHQSSSPFFRGLNNYFLALDVADMLFGGEKSEARDHMLIFLPGDAGMEDSEVSEAAFKQLAESIGRFFEAKKDEYPGAEITPVEKTLMFHELRVDFKGRLCSESLQPGAETCGISILGSYPFIYRTKLPRWLDRAEPDIWHYYSITIRFYKDKSYKQFKSRNEYMFLVELARFMPDNTFIYAAPRKDQDGATPPMIIDNKKIHFFIRPTVREEPVPEAKEDPSKKPAVGNKKKVRKARKESQKSVKEQQAN